MADHDLAVNEGWENVFKLILPYFFIVGIFQLIAYYNLGFDISNYENNKTAFQSLIVVFATLLGTFSTIWLMMKFVDEKPFYTLGLKNHEIGNDVFKGVSLGFIIMFSGFLILCFAKQIEIQAINFDFYSFISGLLLFIFVAISEEILVRGYILKNLLASFNSYIALFISAVIFSLLHVGNPNVDLFSLMQLFVAGILLGIPYIITRKLWFSIATHFSWNFFQGTIFGFNVSGIKQYSIIEIKFHTATIWNGGDFGFEGSLLCLLFQIIAIIFIILKFNKTKVSNYFRFETND
nr:type II CAAX endopeptidase family protein [uncultured Flavobacterium sp.]